MQIFSPIFAFFISLILVPPLFAQTIADIIKEAPNKEVFWSVSIRDEQGNMLESIHAEKLIIPASNQKLLTTAAFLDEFGGAYRFQTNIYGDGELIDSIWHGDIIIRGSGDPTISGFLYDGDRYLVFRRFMEQLQDYGIQSISGNLIADVSLFDAQLYPKGWDWYDLSFYYGVQISPLSFNNNAIDLEVFADGEIGDTPRINWFPDSTDYVKLINKQVITHPNLKYDEYYRRDFGNNEITLASSLPQGYYETESLAIHNPPQFFLDAFANYLNNNGITFSGELLVEYEENVRTGMPVLASHQSPPVKEIVAWINKESDNFYTEMLLKTLAAHKYKQPGTFEDGIQLVRDFLAGQGIDTTYVIMNDGSGMAGGNFTQTAIISDMLWKMLSHPEKESYLSSMAIAGIDGTLAYRMRNQPLFNNFRGKTGYVSGVRTLSGYLRAQSGKRIIVSIAANHFAGKVRPVDLVQERILRYVFENY